MAIKPRICKTCGQKFVPEQENYYYCKWECREEAHKKVNNNKKDGKVRGSGNDYGPQKSKPVQKSYGPPKSTYGPPQFANIQQEKDIETDEPVVVENDIITTQMASNTLLKIEDLHNRIQALEDDVAMLKNNKCDCQNDSNAKIQTCKVSDYFVDDPNPCKYEVIADPTAQATDEVEKIDIDDDEPPF